MNRLSDAPVRAERGRVAYLDMLRIAATVAIVMIHVAVRGWRSMDMHTAQWHALSFFSSISRWGTPIFVMISGALFLDERREVRLRRLFSKNILRILIAFVFWSAIYAVPFFLRDRSVFGLISNFLTGSYQLWFLYMIVGLYLITPLLRRITSDRSALRYFLLLSLCFTFLLPMLGKAIRLADILLHKDGALYAGLTTGYSNMKFYFTLGYVPYFLLGHALNTAQLSKKAERVIYALGLLGEARQRGRALPLQVQLRDLSCASGRAQHTGAARVSRLGLSGGDRRGRRDGRHIRDLLWPLGDPERHSDREKIPCLIQTPDESP